MAGSKHYRRTAVNARLAVIFSDKDRPDAERMLATRVLADYLGDDPTRLAKLLVIAQPDQFDSLFQVAQAGRARLRLFSGRARPEDRRTRPGTTPHQTQHGSSPIPVSRARSK